MDELKTVTIRYFSGVFVVCIFGLNSDVSE